MPILVAVRKSVDIRFIWFVELRMELRINSVNLFNRIVGGTEEKTILSRHLTPPV